MEMQLPEYFINKIIGVFGKAGEAWISNFPDNMGKCIKKWNLTEYTLINDLSYNFVCYAKSYEFGDVVLKMGVPQPGLFKEMEALALLNENVICKCYGIDRELPAMLLERITPGDTLAALKDFNEQLRIAADLIAKAPVLINNNIEFPTYEDWMYKAFERARGENKVGERMLRFIKAAEELFSEIKSVKHPLMLLHGDLHHWNILRDSYGNWKVIDPHGVIGVAYMEAARFMNNHIDVAEILENPSELDKMISVFSVKLGESKKNISLALFTDLVLSTSWTFEEAEPDPKHLINAINKCEFVFDYINKKQYQ
jgi:streptomycin 6-kinase